MPHFELLTHIWLSRAPVKKTDRESTRAYARAIGVLSMAENAVSRKQCANAIRALSMDAVQKAKSGHPGAPMGMADIAEVLWNDFYSHNPSNPNWFNRDRFVLSNGHGSMLIYSLLHLSGYDLSIEDLQQFRQWDSKTPGHPEHGYTRIQSFRHD